MSTVRVKICGITSRETAWWAVEAGASALGFVFAPSPRRVTRKTAKDICRRVPFFVTKVGVFVNEDPEVVAATAGECGLHAVQLHGDEAPEQCSAGKGVGVIKALRVSGQSPEALLAEARRYYNVDGILLDTRVAGRYGGSGKTFDWQIAALFRSQWPGPLILAGGLNSANVEEAVKLVRPDLVDVSSGVEREGRKDRGLIEEFMSRIFRLQGQLLDGTAGGAP